MWSNETGLILSYPMTELMGSYEMKLMGLYEKELTRSYETELMWLPGLPICVRTLSSHWRGPCRWTSIQHGVDVTSCQRHNAKVN
jgi:hypothetical protein